MFILLLSLLVIPASSAPWHVHFRWWTPQPNEGFTNGHALEFGDSWRRHLKHYLVAETDEATLESPKVIINNPHHPVHILERDYFWGNSQADDDDYACWLPFRAIADLPVFDDDDAHNLTDFDGMRDFLRRIQFPNGTKPLLVSWGCKKYEEECCGVGCCEYDGVLELPDLKWVGIFIGGSLLAGAFLGICVSLGLYRIRRHLKEVRRRRSARMMQEFDHEKVSLRKHSGSTKSGKSDHLPVVFEG